MVKNILTLNEICETESFEKTVIKLFSGNMQYVRNKFFFERIHY